MRRKGKSMKQIRMFTMLVAALFLTNMLAANMLAQGSHGLPPVKEQLKMLSDKLSLSSGQQAKVEPILRELHDATEKLMRCELIAGRAPGPGTAFTAECGQKTRGNPERRPEE